MPVIVNGYELNDAEMDNELPAHQDAGDPLKSAMTALVLRRVLLDEARTAGLSGNDESMIDSLLEAEVKVPVPGREECLRQYQAYPSRFTVGELVEASHILFQVTAAVDLDGLRLHAQDILDQLLEQPERFAEMAKRNSNCPSAEVGGNLGQLARGTCVPEFEKCLFTASPGSIVPHLVETRFGLHIVQLGRRAEGRLMAFEDVQGRIADAMHAASYQHALRQYLQLLVGRAEISGIEMPGADSPLLQ